MPCDTEGVITACPLAMSNADRIQQLLSERPGLKAQQIASELGLERSHVAAALQDLAGGELIQDSAYRWWPKTRSEAPSPADRAPARTLLESLCRYYLDCLSRESATGISIPASAADSEYVVLPHLPFANRTGLTADRAVKKIVRKVRQERGQLSLYIGYAVRLRAVHLPHLEELRLEPVL